MLFPTFEFALFFSVVFVVSWLLRPKPQAWRWFLLAASFVFYGAFEWSYTLLLAGSILANQAFAVAIHKREDERQRRVILTAAVVANLAVLGYYKYTDFFIESVDAVLGSLGVDLGWVPLEIILPVAISFFTFQALSYVIDVYRRDAEPSPLLDFAVYLSFFPHLVAGPIVRARELLPQLKERGDPRRVNSALAFRLIIAGLFKKVVISSFLSATIVDDVFASPTGVHSRGRSCGRSTPTRSRSTPTSAATPTSPSAARCCWACGSRRTSTPPTRPCRCSRSGGSGT